MKQTTFASLAFKRKKKQTRRERFLAEMEKVVPWAALLAVIEPHYPRTGRRGRLLPASLRQDGRSGTLLVGGGSAS